MHADASLVAPARNNAKVIGLVSTGHFLSHFYLLLIPPLFPVMREVYGVSYIELGLAITVLGITTGLTQAPVGFLVDRYGARAFLIGGMFLEAAAIALVAVIPHYGALLALMVVAGLANAVYHPANYAILNASVSSRRMGRAFSIHTFAGFLGAAVAPVSVLYLASLTDWRTALIVCASLGAAVACVMALNSDVLLDAHEVRSDEHGDEARYRVRGMRLLFSTPVLMGVLFFVGLSIVNHGFTDFGVSALVLIYDAPLATAGVVLSAFLFVSPFGVLLGGWIADRTARHDLIVAVCFVVVACAIFSVAAFSLSLTGVAVLFAIAGLFDGMVAPSRDMMIRSVTPPGEMGKVFGFVSIGFNIGGIVAPLMYGYLLDQTDPKNLYWAVGIVSLLTIATVLATGRAGRGRRT